jgi:hypothetical protein
MTIALIVYRPFIPIAGLKNIVWAACNLLLSLEIMTLALEPYKPVRIATVLKNLISIRLFYGATDIAESF